MAEIVLHMKMQQVGSDVDVLMKAVLRKETVCCWHWLE